MPVVAGMCRHEPVEPVRVGPGRSVPEPVPAEPMQMEIETHAQAHAGRCLSLPEPLKDCKKRCILNKKFNKSISSHIYLHLLFLRIVILLNVYNCCEVKMC